MANSRDEQETLESVIDRLDGATIRQILIEAAGLHEDVARSLRIRAAGDEERLDVLKTMIDEVLRTRRHLGYSASMDFATEAQPVVDALAEEVRRAPSDDLVQLLQRAIGHLVKVIMRADDSSGLIGDLCRTLLDLHRQACAAGVADPRKLARWMVRFVFEDQDFFMADPVAYADALGDAGLSMYRREVDKRTEAQRADPERSSRDDFYRGFPSFEARYAAERLAIIDRDEDRLIELLGEDLSAPHQFQRVAEAMIELDRPAEALAWARRGIEETNGWQLAKLFDLAADLLSASGDTEAIVELRRHEHERMPSSSTYARLRGAAEAAGSWEAEMPNARSRLSERDPAGLVDALLADGDSDEAWRLVEDAGIDLHESVWLRLAEAREPTAPADAMAVYLRLTEAVLVEANKRAYRKAIKQLKAARRAAGSADEASVFDGHLADLRERNRNRPTFMAMLDNAGF